MTITLILKTTEDRYTNLLEFEMHEEKLSLFFKGRTLMYFLCDVISFTIEKDN